jgi:hypothetical protein
MLPPLLPDATAEYAALLTNVGRFRIATVRFGPPNEAPHSDMFRQDYKFRYTHRLGWIVYSSLIGKYLKGTKFSTRRDSANSLTDSVLWSI